MIILKCKACGKQNRITGDRVTCSYCGGRIRGLTVEDVDGKVSEQGDSSQILDYERTKRGMNNG